MSINFPDNPVTSDVFLLNGVLYVWSGDRWDASVAPGPTGPTGPQPDLGALSVSLLPSSDLAFDLGASDARWRDLYLSGSSIFLGDAVLSSSDGGLSIASSSGGSVAFLTASDAASFATAAQGSLADTAVQPSDSIVVGDGGTIGSASDPDAMAISSGGVVTFSQGIALAAGKGIDFSATADGSGTTTSELFDDYEEGTWTPSYSPATGSFTTMTYNSNGRNGVYTKIGNIVIAAFNLGTDNVNVSGASGPLFVDGLPFAAVTPNSQMGYSGFIGLQYRLNSAFDLKGIYIANAATRMSFQLEASNDTGGDALQVSDLRTGSLGNYNLLRAMVIYRV